MEFKVVIVSSDMKAVEILDSFGVRSSVQRLAVMNFVLENRIHATADKIFAELSKSMPTLSRTTVYNTLNILTQSGAIKALNIEAEAVHFDADLTEHAHFYCTKCRCIEDLELPESVWNMLRAQMPGADLQICYRGLCRKCSDKK